MPRLNGLVTITGQGVYWQLIDVPNVDSDTLLIAVGGQTTQGLEALSRSADTTWIVPPQSSGAPWVFDLTTMRNEIDSSNSSGLPDWAVGWAEAHPLVDRGVMFELTRESLVE